MKRRRKKKWELRTTTGGDDDGRASQGGLGGGAEIGFGGFFLGVDVLLESLEPGLTPVFAGANRVIIGLSIIRKGRFSTLTDFKKGD